MLLVRVLVDLELPKFFLRVRTRHLVRLLSFELLCVILCNHLLAIDIWSAGVMMLTLFTGRYPFFNSPDDLTGISEICCVFGATELKASALAMSSLFYSSWPFLYLLNPGIDRVVTIEERIVPVRKVTLQELCLKMNPDLASQLPEAAFDLLSRCLSLNPKQRCSAKEAMEHPFLSSD